MSSAVNEMSNKLYGTPCEGQDINKSANLTNNIDKQFFFGFVKYFGQKNVCQNGRFQIILGQKNSSTRFIFG